MEESPQTHFFLEVEFSEASAVVASAHGRDDGMKVLKTWAFLYSPGQIFLQANVRTVTREREREKRVVMKTALI